MVRSAEIGLVLSGDDPWPSLLEWAGRCRSGGWRRVWLSDQGAAVAKAAGLGRSIPSLRIGLLVDPTRRLPTVLAKDLTSLDVVIGGRLDVAVDDRVGRPAGSEPPGAAVVEETTAVLVGLAAGEPLSYEGDRVRAQGARCLPASPQRPAYPVWRLLDKGRGCPPASSLITGPGSPYGTGPGVAPPSGWAGVGGWLAVETG